MDMGANVYTGLEVQAAEGSSTVNVRNITFDGNNVAIESFFIATGNVNFENVTFHNCITPYGGGAVQLRGGNYQFNNCTFSNNQASVGGHISGNSDSTISIKNCTFTGGYSTARGGAIAFGSSTSTCTIESSLIKDNKADDIGGGIENAGNLTISDTKVYNNTAKNGGSDISNTQTGTLSLNDSLESLVKSFATDKLLPDGWIDESKPDELVMIPGNISGMCKLKLKYSVIEDKPDPDPTPDPLPKPDDKPKPDESKPDESKPIPAPIINNYYTDDHTRTTRTETTILPQPPETVKTAEPAKQQEQVIKFESNLQQGVPQIIDDGNGTITVNVNVTSNAAKGDGGEIQPTNSITWIQAVIACLLFGILVCLLRRR